jgi:branched-chain amino acid transport system ATP-binding protein
MANPNAAPRTSAPPVLQVDDLRAGYGKRPVLHGISFEVPAQEVLVILGLNGAGKTTTALTLAGALQPWSGSITYEGRQVDRWKVHDAVNNGIVLVPEGRRVFPELTVAQNLAVGGWTSRRDAHWLESRQERVYAHFPRLAERRDQAAGTLSGGEQQMLAIARGLMARPRLLIVDEASMGLAPTLVEDVFDIIRQIRDEEGVTIVLVEQHIGALRIADAALVIEQGTIAARFRGRELRDPSRVRKIFLG